MKGDRTRNQFVETAARLFQAHGFHGVGLTQLIEESGAPKGSFYYHFPGGKEELALAAIAYSDGEVRALLNYAERTAQAADGYIGTLSKGLRKWLRDSHYAAGCPVAGLTLELATGAEEVALACRDAYAGWIDSVARALNRFGLPLDKSQDLAVVLVSAFEGSVIVARASRSTKPLDLTARFLISAIASDS
jgi:TetR/AcrR family transcriptional regulator, lmrAB and yxaGH operons repressor